MKKVDKKKSELNISVVAKADEWKKEIEKAKKELLKNITVKGFRKGSVPADVAAKHVSDNDAWAKALPKMLDILVKEAAKEIKDEKLIAGPNYDVEKISGTELEVRFVYPMYPEIKIGDYKKHGIKYEENKIDESVIENDLKQLQLKHAVLIPKEGGKIGKGDIVTFDFDGYVDGKPFEGGKSENYELEIGSGQFIAGFEDKMMGLKKGEEADLELKFPDDYHAEHLKGKTTTFKVKVHEIKTKKLPNIDDDLAKESGVKDVKTLDELKAYIKGILEKQAKQNARTKFQREVFTKLSEGLDIPIPAQLIAQEMNQQKSQFEQQIKQQGMDIKKYLEVTKMDPEQLMAQFRATSQERLVNAFIYAEISKAEKIELKDADYEEEYKKLAVVYGQTVDAVKGTITKEQMQIPMVNDRVLDILIG